MPNEIMMLKTKMLANQEAKLHSKHGSLYQLPFKTKLIDLLI